MTKKHIYFRPTTAQQRRLLFETWSGLRPTKPDYAEVMAEFVAAPLATTTKAKAEPAQSLKAEQKTLRQEQQQLRTSRREVRQARQQEDAA